MSENILSFWKNHPDHTIAIEMENNKITYKQFSAIIDARAEYFKSLGIEKGDHVGLLINYQLDYLEAFFALWSFDVTIIPFDTQINFSSLLQICKEADIHYLVSDKKDILQAISKHEYNPDYCYRLQKLIYLSKKESIEYDFNSPVYKYSWIKEQDITTETGFFILFSSGTSGKNKGVVIKKNAFINNVKKVIQYTDLKQTDSMLLKLPLSYSFALSQVMSHLYIGGKIVFTNNAFYNSFILLEIKKENITNFSATPYFYETIVKEYNFNNSHMDFPNFRFFMSAGGYLSPEIIHKVRKLFPTVTFYNNYGQTEASPRICYNKIDEKAGNIRTVGKPLPGIIIKIFDEQGNELPSNTPGEIGYMSEDIMFGYYQHKPLKQDSFFMSGDVGCLDDNDELIIYGRKDSLLKINGRKVYKNFIENEFLKLPYIRNIKLKKERHEIYGEYFVAYVIPEGNMDSKMIIDKIYDYSVIKFNSYERPKKILICREIPLNSNKKVSIKSLQDSKVIGSSYELYENG